MWNARWSRCHYRKDPVGCTDETTELGAIGEDAWGQGGPAGPSGEGGLARDYLTVGGWLDCLLHCWKPGFLLKFLKIMCIFVLQQGIICISNCWQCHLSLSFSLPLSVPFRPSGEWLSYRRSGNTIWELFFLPCNPYPKTVHCSCKALYSALWPITQLEIFLSTE